MNKVWVKNFFNKLIESELLNDEEKIQENIEYKNNNLPRYIYKYQYFCENHINSLKNNTIYLSSPSLFNDTFDCSSVLTYEQYMLGILLYDDSQDDSFHWPQERKNRFIKQLQNGDSYKKIIEKDMLKLGFSKYECEQFYKESLQDYHEILTNMDKELKDSYKMTCFTDNMKSNAMWIYYSKNHTGFCIEYDLNDLNEFKGFKKSLYPIIYTKKPILSSIDTFKYTKATKGMITLLNKSSELEHEREYRLLVSSKHKDYYQMPKPSCIYLENKSTLEDRNTIEEIAKRNGIMVKYVKAIPNSFCLKSVIQ